jgi:hypothetical protein
MKIFTIANRNFDEVIINVHTNKKQLWENFIEVIKDNKMKIHDKSNSTYGDKTTINTYAKFCKMFKNYSSFSIWVDDECGEQNFIEFKEFIK